MAKTVGSMKTILCFLLSAFCLAASAATNLLSLTYVNGTNNGAAIAVTNVVFSRQEFIFQSLGITNALGGSYLTNGVTNAITINLQYSVDAANSNWITLATWKRPRPHRNHGCDNERTLRRFMMDSPSTRPVRDP